MSIDALKDEIARHFGTPAIVVDVDIVDHNIAQLQAHCDDVGVANRPHTKTHKIPALAKGKLRRAHIAVHHSGVYKAYSYTRPR